MTVRHFWNGFLLLDFARLPDLATLDFGGGLVSGVYTDTAGRLHHYLRRHPGLKLKDLRHLDSGAWNETHIPPELPEALKSFIRTDPKNGASGFFSEIYQDMFFHFRAGGNWQGVMGDASQGYADRYSNFIDWIVSAISCPQHN